MLLINPVWHCNLPPTY